MQLFLYILACFSSFQFANCISVCTFLSFTDTLDRSNELDVIPDCFYDLVSLTELDVSHNVIYVINDDIGKLVNLRKLVLSYNRLQQLPTAVRYELNMNMT